VVRLREVAIASGFAHPLLIAALRQRCQRERAVFTSAFSIFVTSSPSKPGI
jgi:hypothetical protein